MKGFLREFRREFRGTTLKKGIFWKNFWRDLLERNFLEILWRVFGEVIKKRIFLEEFVERRSLWRPLLSDLFFEGFFKIYR